MHDPTQPYLAGQGMVIPARMLGGIRRYIEQGIEPGQFWQAVLRNDLRKAAEHADDCNARIIPAFMRYLYNEAPAECWGSPEKYQAWLARFRPRPAEPTSCGYCSYEEADGELIEQCPKCKAADAAKGHAHG